MRILILGGSGFIGSNLADRLAKDGHEITLLDKNPPHQKAKNIRYVHGDITEKITMKKAFKNIDVVYHLASLLAKKGLPDAEYWKVNFEGTKNIFELSLSSKIKQLVYVSSAGIIKSTKNRPLKEGDPFEPDNAYKQTKIACEKFLTSKSDKLNITICRPESAYGPRDMGTVGLVKMIKNGRFIMPTSGKNLINPTYVSDIVQGFELVLMNEKAWGKTFIFAGKEIVTSRKFMEIMAELVDRKVSNLYIPEIISQAAATSLDFLGKHFKFTPPFSRLDLEFFQMNRFFDTSLARKDLGYKPGVGLKKGMKRTVEWYAENGFL